MSATNYSPPTRAAFGGCERADVAIGDGAKVAARAPAKLDQMVMLASKFPRNSVN